MGFHVEHRHTITVPLPVENAFPLFTPAGEQLWLEEWQPEFLYPDDGRTEAGMVFRTHHGGEETVWSCIEFAPEQHRIRYVRVSSATRFVTLHIGCRRASATSTSVEIRYALTALTTEGTRMLKALTPTEFASNIDRWQEKIACYAAGRPANTPLLDKCGYVSADTPCNADAASVSPGA